MTKEFNLFYIVNCLGRANVNLMKYKSLFLGLAIASIIPIFILVTGIVNAEPYGWSPDVDNSWGGPPSRVGPKLDKAPILIQPNISLLPRATNPGEVRLFWHKVPGATGYHVYFGLSPGNYIFSAPDLPDTDNYTVSFLVPGRTYYFAVQAIQGYSVSDLSNEWWAVAGGSSSSNETGEEVLGDQTSMAPVRDTLAYQSYEENTQENSLMQAQALDEYTPVTTEPVRVENQMAAAPRPTPNQTNFWQKLIAFIWK
ncbi:hypothetical protein A3I80_00970 [Candidatus Gottesmanbacteria bacterium RIFCSPLOWO2_02_FULL_40_10]|nr:MAG: hypothetical protein A3I80_00970 [Candidatus Gottesmanbacteria bacterium RIFCSPLOWO2_02_FULL_40_10]